MNILNDILILLQTIKKQSCLIDRPLNHAYSISTPSGSSQILFEDNFLLVTSMHTNYIMSDVMQMHIDTKNSEVPIPGISGFALYDPVTSTVSCGRA